VKSTCLLAGCLAGLCALPAVAEPVDYGRDVKPLLRARCCACHGALKQKAKLRLDTADAIHRGGRHGPAVQPGEPAASLLIERVTETDAARRMPPEGRPLSGQEVTALRTWIVQGAKGPADEKPEVDPRSHWAFRPPVRTALPAGGGTPSGNPIDAFLADVRRQRGLPAAPPADRATLLRRVYLDLIGLPPTRAELHAFLDDRAPDAYEKIVDRLLASPQYGERWARHWMDLWRYSDWYGRRSVPDVMNSYPQIWRWRDWIVRCLNEDRGYDHMVRQMLAADELSPEDDAELVATGFLVRSWFKWNYEQWMKDLVEHTGKAFLGLTLNCCHCHDHKYDPITQEEYFRFRAFFEPLELRQDRVRGEADPGAFRKYVYTESYGPIQSGMVRVFDEKLDAKTYVYAKGDARNRIEGRPPVTPGVPAALGGARLRIEPVRLPPVAWYPGLKRFVQEEEVVRRAVAALTKAGTPYVPLGSVYPATSTGRRTALAGWITARNNPLTARVAVNHLWAWHFGRPLVETTHDFGRNGKLPTHPALLDWLAVELMENGWRMKPLHRLLVTSAAYRMRSSLPGDAGAAGRATDPEDRFLWRFPGMRMEAEVVRDSVLHVAGELDRTPGGPEVPHEQGQVSRRRSLYFAAHGEGKMQFLELFDAANPCECYRRTVSVQPQQALALSNSELVLRQSRLLTHKLWDQLPAARDARSYVRAAFEQVLCRLPSAAEEEASLAFLTRQEQLLRQAGTQLVATGSPAGWVAPAAEPAARAREGLIVALFNHNDFVTIR
jgi:hypothetical protein